MYRRRTSLAFQKRKAGGNKDPVNPCQPLPAAAWQSPPHFEQPVQGVRAAPARGGTHSPGMDGGQEENEWGTIGFLMDTHLLCHRSSDFGAPQI